MAAIRRLLFTAALIVSLERAAFPRTDMELVVNSLYQDGHGGRQTFDGSGDQSLTLYEPVLYMNSQINPDTGVFGSVVFDTLSSASNKAFDSGTGASGSAGWQTRTGGDIGISRRIGTWTLTPTAGYSTELSYRSVHGGLNAQRSFAEDNFTVSAGVFHFADAADPWDFSQGKFSGFRSKTTNSANVAASQLLSENEIALCGVSYTRQNGFLEGTRNTVSTGTVTERAPESLPNARKKFTASARYIRSLGEDLAFHMDYRYYADDWRIRAHTWEPSLAFSMQDEKYVLRLLYRLYHQTAAKYYADSFPGVINVMTSDSDLARFTAREGGVQFSYTPEPAEGARTEWSWGGSAIYYKRSNGLRALILQCSAGARF